MVKRVALLFVSLLLLGFAAAGCGEDENENGGGGGDQPAQQSPSGETGAGGAAEPSASVREQVETCKRNARTASQLSAEVRADVEDLCEKVGQGDRAAAQEATRDICKKIVRESAPAGPTRERTLRACEQAGRTPTP